MLPTIFSDHFQVVLLYDYQNPSKLHIQSQRTCPSRCSFLFSDLLSSFIFQIARVMSSYIFSFFKKFGAWRSGILLFVNRDIIELQANKIFPWQQKMETLKKYYGLFSSFTPVINYMNCFLEMEWPKLYHHLTHRNSLLSLSVHSWGKHCFVASVQDALSACPG